ncbi:hypothetical protein Tco_1397702, partial [Tanacetum coccineum]
ITGATTCRPSAICIRDHDDYQDDNARPEGKSSAKRQKTSEYGTHSVGSQEQLDEFDAWMEDAGTDDDENNLKNDIVWESRKERLTLLTPKKKAPIVFSCQRDPKVPPLTLMNQDLFYLKHGNLGPKKYTMSLHKFSVVPFPDDDMEERTSRWVDKHLKKFNVYARYSVEHWKNIWAKQDHIRRQKQLRNNPREVYSELKIVGVTPRQGGIARHD